jgi:hypothetical protein
MRAPRREEGPKAPRGRGRGFDRGFPSAGTQHFIADRSAGVYWGGGGKWGVWRPAGPGWALRT